MRIAESGMAGIAGEIMNNIITALLLGLLIVGCDRKPDKKQDSRPAKLATTPAFNTPTTLPAEDTTMKTDDILFSTPTLNDSLPTELGPTAIGNECYQMHEDDWRQFEFVSESFRQEVASELHAIDRIWTEKSVSVGNTMTAFREVHIRKNIPIPLDVPMSIADFEKLFDGKRLR